MKFIVMPYEEEQNEPSRPERELLEVKGVKELKEKAHELFTEFYPAENDDFFLVELTFEKEDGTFGDYQIYADTSHIFFTKVKEPKVKPSKPRSRRS